MVPRKFFSNLIFFVYTETKLIKKPPRWAIFFCMHTYEYMTYLVIKILIEYFPYTSKYSG